MDTVDITLNLPQDLVERAKLAGLLTDERIASLLESTLERGQRIDGFFDDLERLSTLKPRISDEAIDAEIQAYRREK